MEGILDGGGMETQRRPCEDEAEGTPLQVWECQKPPGVTASAEFFSQSPGEALTRLHFDFGCVA